MRNFSKILTHRPEQLLCRISPSNDRDAVHQVLHAWLGGWIAAAVQQRNHVAGPGQMQSAAQTVPPWHSSVAGTGSGNAPQSLPGYSLTPRTSSPEGTKSSVNRDNKKWCCATVTPTWRCTTPCQQRAMPAILLLLLPVGLIEEDEGASLFLTSFPSKKDENSSGQRKEKHRPTSLSPPRGEKEVSSLVS